MSDNRAELPRATPPDLKALVRRARLDDAERSSVIAELRGAELARLEVLRDALEPVFEQVPAHAELFDHGLVPGDKPRLFVDIVSFVEMARDRRCYRFIQDTRAGVVVLAESDKVDIVTHEVANYLARRLVEREKALSTPYPPEQDRPAVPAASASAFAAAPAPAGRDALGEPRRGSGWAIALALLLGCVVGAGLAMAYAAGQFAHLWPISW